MKKTAQTLATGVAPAEWFTGSVYIDPVAAPATATGSTQASFISRRSLGRLGTRIRMVRPSSSSRGLGLHNGEVGRSK